MKVGYLDTSVAVAIAFEDSGGAFMARSISSFDRIYSSILLKTEFLHAAYETGDFEVAMRFLEPVRFVYPDNALEQQSIEVMKAGRTTAVEMHHLATALYLFPKPDGVYFISASENQQKTASRLGFLCDFL